MNESIESKYKTEFHVFTDPEVIYLRIDKLSGYVIGKMSASDARKVRTMLTRAIKEVEAKALEALALEAMK